MLTKKSSSNKMLLFTTFVNVPKIMRSQSIIRSSLIRANLLLHINIINIKCQRPNCKPPSSISFLFSFSKSRNFHQLIFSNCKQNSELGHRFSYLTGLLTKVSSCSSFIFPKKILSFENTRLLKIK